MSPSSPTIEIPFPPPELRQLVGDPPDRHFDNPSETSVFPELPASAYDSVLDWGCGCGRIARQLLQQQPRPRAYLGVDLHRGMVRWCQRNLAPLARGFRFEHLDVRNLGLNPKGAAEMLAFPLRDGEASLVLGWSVFTHVVERVAAFYLREVARVLRPDGVAITTWFLFEKAGFPMLQDFQNALYVNDVDVTNAVIYDRHWLRAAARREGLVLSRINAPAVRGFQWRIDLRPAAPGVVEAPFPTDEAPIGLQRPPMMPADAPDLE